MNACPATNKYDRRPRRLVMVVAFQPNVLRFVHALHRSERTDGIDTFLRTRPSLVSSRNVCRWHRALVEALTYYPSVAYAALGLTHVHLIIEDPRTRWEQWPYAVRASWLVASPAGTRVLYLHFLVPQAHAGLFAEVLHACRSPQGDRITSITTTDGWQFLDHDQHREVSWS